MKYLAGLALLVWVTVCVIILVGTIELNVSRGWKMPTIAAILFFELYLLVIVPAIYVASWMPR